VAGLLAAAGDAAGYEVVVDGLQSKYPFQALLAILNFLPLETRDKEGKPVDWVKPLARVLNSPSRSQSTRHDAVCVLGRIATPAARATLSERLKVEEDIVVRMCIKTVLWPPKVFASPNDPAFQRAG
jgi:HEAT repeat protein